MRTSVLAAKRALRSAIAADAAFDGFLVRMGLAPEEPTERERVYVLDNQPREYAPTTQQAGKNEAFVLPVIIETKAIGGNATEADRDAAEDRMEDLVEALISLVEGEDQPLDGEVWQAGVERIVGPHAAPLVDGWLVQCTVEFGCVSRLF